MNFIQGSPIASGLCWKKILRVGDFPRICGVWWAIADTRGVWGVGPPSVWGVGGVGERGRHGDAETRRRGDAERGRGGGEGETRRRGDAETPSVEVFIMGNLLSWSIWPREEQIIRIIWKSAIDPNLNGKINPLETNCRAGASQFCNELPHTSPPPLPSPPSSPPCPNPGLFTNMRCTLPSRVFWAHTGLTQNIRG